MTIVFVSEFFPESEHGDVRGGVEARCFSMALELTRRHRVVVIASREPGLRDRQTIAGLNVIRVGRRRRFTQSGGLFARLMFIISVAFTRLPEKPDIVDAQAIMAYVPAYFLARRYRARAVATLHDSWLGRWVKLFGPLGFVGELYERLYLHFSWDGIVANSRGTLERIRSRVKGRKTTVIHNGVTVPLISAVEPRENSVCIVSRLVKYKRVDDVLRALVLLRDRGRRVTCTVIGSGADERALRSFAQSAGLSEQVRFLGRVEKHDDVLREIAASLVFCLPSEVEGFGIVTVEAAAVGRPYVNSDIPATREVTENGLGGILYRLGDVRALADGIERLIIDKALYRAKQVELQKLIQQYQWSERAEETERFYGQLRLAFG
ncbi:MAG: glycosyltransferase family 4 protein [Candidatus Kerfeldbacteria bacterium]|nr:glycosyltransferase family 4 protein [Candidatus Kerfeldbacteria bacterium]